MFSLLIRSSLLFTLFCSIGLAQLPAFQKIDSTLPHNRFGGIVSGAGDVNGDGYDDIIVNSTRLIGGALSGGAKVFSGLDGSLLHNFFEGFPSAQFYRLTVSGAGDVNADGFDDVIIGTPFESTTGLNGGRARVFSGLDGTLLYLFQGTSRFGSAVSDAGDVNNDGYDDVMVSDPREQHFSANLGTFHYGTIYIYSGIDGTILRSHAAPPANPTYYTPDQWGHAIACAGDIDGDGIPDAIFGAESDYVNGINAGAALVFSGATGLRLLRISGAVGGGFLGRSVAGAGDVDNDGFDDVIVGVPGGLPNNPAMTFGGAQVYSGATGVLLHEFFGGTTSFRFGQSVSSAGDFNGDGHDDLIVGAPLAANPTIPGGGKVRVFSGFDGAVLATYFNYVLPDGFGESVSSAGDVNGDGYSDVVVGAPQENNFAGTARIFLGRPFNTQNMSTAFAASHGLLLDWQPTNGVADSLTGSLVCTGAAPGGQGLAISSLAAADILYFGFLPVLVRTQPGDIYVYEPFHFDSSGELHAVGINRQIPALAGHIIHTQFFELSPLVLSSNAVQIFVEP